MQANNHPNEKFERQHYIDALRVFAVFMLIIFHTAQVFVSWESWNIINDKTSIFADLLSSFIGASGRGQHLVCPAQTQRT